MTELLMNKEWPPVRSFSLWDDQWSEMFDFGLNQNHKYATSVDKRLNWIIFNRLSVIQIQHWWLIIWHSLGYI